ncbi:MAG: hypothetical protein Q7R81_00405 [Candidatus Peregrinibacteria bacterium]|nr:hypothetical protein [Candidatus Peregrinibacteria bacterium]
MKVSPAQIAERIVPPEMGRSLPVGAQFPENTLDDFIAAFEVARTRYLAEMEKWENTYDILFDPCIDLKQLYAITEKERWSRVIDGYLGRIDLRDDVASGITAIQDQARAAFRDRFSHLESKPESEQQIAREASYVNQWKEAAYWLRYHVELHDKQVADESDKGDTKPMIFSMEELESSLDPIVGLMIIDILKRRTALGENF